MCGFLVEYSPKKLVFKEDFLDLLALSQKRGPDFQGYWTNDKVAQMGFNRLAILDLSEAGQQPMTSFGQRYSIVFNGEIYNHLELRKRMAFTNFRGTSDTETITACLEEWGITKTITELDGMFSLAIFDHLSHEMTLVRDFAGIKPLFYGWDGMTLVASSQYDQILKHPQYKNQPIDSSVLKLYLQQHFMPAPLGLYQNTFQVLPGEMITFTLEGHKKHHRYWELPDTNLASIFDRAEAEKYISETLEACVQEQLIADVPLGAFLSGGVDSPLVCALAKIHQPNLQVFSIGSDSKVHDESERATQFANALGVKQKLWQLNAQEMKTYWEEVTEALHEPLADFSILPTYLVSKLAKKKVTVALSGDGGDELFLGYERFWSVGKNLPFQHYPKLLRQAIYGFDKYTTGNKKVNSVLLASEQGQAHEHLHSRFRKNWLDQVAPDLQEVSLPEEWKVYDYDNAKDERDLMAKMRKAEFYGMMQKTLRKVDLASMENSLEVRVPFLQKKMIEASLHIDPMLSYGNGQQKQLLKDMLAQQIPNVAREEVKKGFSVPLTKWIKEDLKDTFATVLLEKDITAYGFDKKAVEKMWNIHLKGEADLKWPLFTLYALLK